MTGPTARLNRHRLEVREAAGHVAHTDDRAGQLVAQLPGPVTERRTQMAPVPTKALDIASRGAALPRKETLHMVATAAPISRTIDRSACPADRHGTASAARNHRCACPDARRALKHQRAARDLGRSRDPYVDSTGTIRRRQALLALGWSCEQIAAAAGVATRTVQCVNAYGPRTRRSAADRMRRAYDHLLSLPRPTGHDATRNRGQARQLGYLRPDQWADIDDPAELPDSLFVRGGDVGPAGDDIRFLASPDGGSLTPERIAAQLRVDHDVVEHHLRAVNGRPGHLTDDQLYDIRAAYLRAIRDGHRWSSKAVAADYGVSEFTLSQTLTGKARAHLGLTDLTVHKRGHHRAVSPGGTTREENAA